MDAVISRIAYFLPIVFGCHRRPDRSFFYKGKQFPICARCTGELIGILSCLILFWFWKPGVRLSFILLIPLIVDGFVQRLTSYESTNFRRCVTGILFGVGLTALFVHSTVYFFDLGFEYGKSLRQ